MLINRQFSPDLPSVHDAARGKWRGILGALRIAVPDSAGRHAACPACGGADRFRFTDVEGSGSFYCSGCGGKDALGGAGSGIDLVMRCRGVNFQQACKLVEDLLPGIAVEVPRTRHAQQRLDGRAMWDRALPIRQGDVVSQYLSSRGLEPRHYPSQLRIMDRALYVHEDKRKEWLPAMVAHFLAPDGSTSTTHFTFLDHEGRKANVGSVRKFYPGSVPQGGAVRLAKPAATMGVAEGIETSLGAMKLTGLPVWATVATASLVKWQPPDIARHIIIFGDHDAGFGGQMAAYSLAYRLRHMKQPDGSSRFDEIEVRMPGIAIDPDMVGCDWNDVVLGGA